MAKYRKRFRNGSARLKGWDYRNPSAYFITICTHNRQHFFGECTHGTMKLSTMGAIVQGFWYEIPKFSPHVKLGAFVVMPDHLHGILILTDRPPIKKTR
jgi:putative transposase